MSVKKSNKNKRKKSIKSNKNIKSNKKISTPEILSEVQPRIQKEREKLQCPCCGFFTIDREEPEFDICPVCFWEYDPVQNADPEYAGGANDLSLKECRENYTKIGACEERFLTKVRAALEEEK